MVGGHTGSVLAAGVAGCTGAQYDVVRLIAEVKGSAKGRSHASNENALWAAVSSQCSPMS
jgi:hypothetical protein